MKAGGVEYHCLVVNFYCSCECLYLSVLIFEPNIESVLKNTRVNLEES